MTARMVIAIATANTNLAGFDFGFGAMFPSWYPSWYPDANRCSRESLWKNAVGALDPNHMTALQDMTKVQLPHHHGDFHFA